MHRLVLVRAATVAGGRAKIAAIHGLTL